jgi:hypothetical protein
MISLFFKIKILLLPTTTVGGYSSKLWTPDTGTDGRQPYNDGSTHIILLIISLISSSDLISVAFINFNTFLAHLGDLSWNPYSVKTHDFRCPPRGMGYDRVDCSSIRQPPIYGPIVPHFGNTLKSTLYPVDDERRVEIFSFM